VGQTKFVKPEESGFLRVTHSRPISQIRTMQEGYPYTHSY